MISGYKGIFPRIAASAFVADNADVIGDVEIGEESSVWFQTVLRGDVASDSRGNPDQHPGWVHSARQRRRMPTILGNWVTVGHRVILHACRVDNHCLIGMGAVVLSRAHVGEGSIVAAGALVPEGTVIPPGSLYLGVPARFERKLAEADRRLYRLPRDPLPGVQGSVHGGDGKGTGVPSLPRRAAGNRRSRPLRTLNHRVQKKRTHPIRQRDARPAARRNCASGSAWRKKLAACSRPTTSAKSARPSWSRPRCLPAAWGPTPTSSPRRCTPFRTATANR